MPTPTRGRSCRNPAPTPSIVYSGNDGGLSRSTNGGVTWTPLSAGGLQTSLFYNIDMRPDATGSINVGALQDNEVETTAGAVAPGWVAHAGRRRLGCRLRRHHCRTGLLHQRLLVPGAVHARPSLHQRRRHLPYGNHAVGHRRPTRAAISRRSPPTRATAAPSTSAAARTSGRAGTAAIPAPGASFRRSQAPAT